MEKLPNHTPDLTAKNIEKLAELFPNVITETRNEEGEVKQAVDFDLLRQELSDHLVEGPQERYQLDWPGKRQALLTANAPIAKTLRPVREESVDFDNTKNLFIEGDNLDALKLLQESYLGKVKLIYIDPPYNTGNDYVYQDDFSETNADYLEKSGQIDKDGNRLNVNSESNGRFHSNWLSMIHPRLKLSRRLLTEDGVIFISIDDNEIENLLKLGKEVFGSTNHLNTFVWKKGGTGKNDSRCAIAEHEYIVAFAKDAQLASFGDDPEAEVTTSYSHEDELGRYSLVRLDSKTLGYVDSLDFGVTGPDGQEYFPEQPEGESKVARWRWGKEKVGADYESLVFRNGYVYTKNYEKEGARPRTLLAEKRFGVTRSGRKDAEDALGNTGLFDFPKPVRLIEHLISIMDDETMTVMDFFAGSGTTAEAVLSSNARDGGQRRFILVQVAESTPTGSRADQAGFSTIAQLSRERVSGAGRKRGVEAPRVGGLPDAGFRALAVATTTFGDVIRRPDQVEQEELLADTENRSQHTVGEDLLFECLIDWGLELSLPISSETLVDHEVLTVDGGSIIACFDEEIDSDLVREIAGREPLRAVFRDSGFRSDADRINAEQIFQEVSPVTEVKVI